MPRRAASASSSIHIHRTTPRPPPARSRLGDRHHYAWPIAISSTPAPRCLTSQIPQMTPCIVPRPPSSLLPLPSIAMGVVLGRLRKPYSKRATGHKPSIPPSLAHLSVRARLHTAWQRRRCRCRCRRCCCCCCRNALRRQPPGFLTCPVLAKGASVSKARRHHPHQMTANVT